MTGGSAGRCSRASFTRSICPRICRAGASTSPGGRRRRHRHHRPRRRHAAVRARRRAGGGERDDVARRHGPRGPGGRRDGRCALLQRRARPIPRRLHHALRDDRLRSSWRDGSLIGRDCMTQAPKGEVVLRTADGRRELCRSSTKISMSARSRLFQDAVAGRGAPSATGEDGIKSLSVALATLEAARSGARPPLI